MKYMSRDQLDTGVRKKNVKCETVFWGLTIAPGFCYDKLVSEIL